MLTEDIIIHTYIYFPHILVIEKKTTFRKECAEKNEGFRRIQAGPKLTGFR